MITFLDCLSCMPCTLGQRLGQETWWPWAPAPPPPSGLENGTQPWEAASDHLLIAGLHPAHRWSRSLTGTSCAFSPPKRTLPSLQPQLPPTARCSDSWSLIGPHPCQSTQELNFCSSQHPRGQAFLSSPLHSLNWSLWIHLEEDPLALAGAALGLLGPLQTLLVHTPTRVSLPTQLFESETKCYF